MPFAHVARTVEVRGCVRTLQILANNALIATHPRHTVSRLVINPAHYEGPATARVISPPPLGRMRRALAELAKEPIAHRSIEMYAQLMEVG